MPDFHLPSHSPLFGLHKCKNFVACKINLGLKSEISDKEMLSDLNMEHITHYIVVIGELQILSSNEEDNEIVLTNDEEYKQFEKAMNDINKTLDIKIEVDKTDKD